MSVRTVCRALVVLALCWMISSCQPAVEPPRQVGPAPHLEKPDGLWNLTRTFEFEEPVWDASAWQTEYRWGRTNGNELQYYAADAITIHDGALDIVAEARSMGGKDYVSGIVTSDTHFLVHYGFVEARVRVPAGQGLWPALWLLDNGTGAAEIDLMEVLGDRPDIAYMTLHYAEPVTGQNANTGSSVKGTDFSAGYHIFGVDWNPEAVTWYVDGVQRYRLTKNVPHGALYFLANLAVGGDWPGAPNAETLFPAHFMIDWIRVYERVHPPLD